MDNIITKKCIKCGEYKTFADFPKNKNKKDGLSVWCKCCNNENAKKYRIEKPEEARSANRKWISKNLDRWKETIRNWKAKNYDKELIRKRKWQANYYKENTEKATASYKKWSNAHPEKVREHSRVGSINRRALIRGNGGVITKKEWDWLKEFYNYTCLCCGKREPEILITLDHVLPLKLGGENIIKNAQPLCKSCNSRKGAKHIDYRPLME